MALDATKLKQLAKEAGEIKAELDKAHVLEADSATAVTVFKELESLNLVPYAADNAMGYHNTLTAVMAPNFGNTVQSPDFNTVRDHIHQFSKKWAEELLALERDDIERLLG